MPIVIGLTTADHGGRVSTGKCGTAECGVSCNCGCPYTAMEEQQKTEWIHDIEARYPNQWLGLVIPPEEDEFHPQRAMLVVYSHDDNEVWDAMSRVTHNQIIHVYFNGSMSSKQLEEWAESMPAPAGATLAPRSPWGGEFIPLNI